jgi:hypothetical protein
VAPYDLKQAIHGNSASYNFFEFRASPVQMLVRLSDPVICRVQGFTLAVGHLRDLLAVLDYNDLNLSNSFLVFSISRVPSEGESPVPTNPFLGHTTPFPPTS